MCLLISNWGAGTTSSPLSSPFPMPRSRQPEWSLPSSWWPQFPAGQWTHPVGGIGLQNDMCETNFIHIKYWYIYKDNYDNCIIYLIMIYRIGKRPLDSGLLQHFRAHEVLWPVRVHQQLGQIVLVLCLPLFLNPCWHVECNLSLVILRHSTQPGFRCFSKFLLGWGQILCLGQDRWEQFLFYLQVSSSHPNYLQVEVMYRLYLDWIT